VSWVSKLLLYKEDQTQKEHPIIHALDCVSCFYSNNFLTTARPTRYLKVSKFRPVWF